MGVRIDESGREAAAFRVNERRTVIIDDADGRDFVARDSHIRSEGGRTSSVYNPAVFYD